MYPAITKLEILKIFKFNEISLIISIFDVDEFNIYIALRYKAHIKMKTLYQRTRDKRAEAFTKKRSVFDLKIGGSGILKSVDEIERISF